MIPIAQSKHLLPEAGYQNLMEDLAFREGKPTIAEIAENEHLAMKRVTLKAGVTLACHQTVQPVTVVWLRGKGAFTVGETSYTVQPGTMITMAAGTPHGASAETDCVFLVLNYKEPFMPQVMPQAK